MKVYFFSGSHYIQVTRGQTGAGSVSPGFTTPQPISDWKFPKFHDSEDVFGANGIDAVLYSGSKCYFFQGPYYVRMTQDNPGTIGTQDFAYPHDISEWGWHSNFGANGIDAALWSGPVTYFFSGNQYIRVTRGESDFGNGGDPGYPATIADGWGWPAPFANKIKGALPSGLVCYFFSGSEYIRVRRGLELAGYIDKTYPANIENWNWPTTFGFGENGIDAALYSGGDLEPQPQGGLQSDVNYWIGSNGSNLTDVSVTVNVDDNLISAANGFSFQLNTISNYVPGTSRATIQQLVIYSDNGTDDLIARLFVFGSNATGSNANFPVMLDLAKSLGTLPGTNRILAGSSLTFTVQYDAPTSKLTGCQFTFTPATGGPATVELNLGDADWGSTNAKATLDNMAPINALTMDIVGDYNSNLAKFTEGEGTITYAAAEPLLAYTNLPSFSNVRSITGEKGNITYAALPANRPIDVSQLWGLTPSVPVDLTEVARRPAPDDVTFAHSLPPPPGAARKSVPNRDL